MQILEINSKKHGYFKVILDDEDFEKISRLGKTNKWCARVCKDRHNLVYFQKRLSNQKLIELHRFIMGFPKGQTVDHINGDTLDNRKKNLRICLNRANIRKGKIRVNNTSGYTGIVKRKDYPNRPFVAKIRVNYKNMYLGSYKTFDEAVIARKKGELKYYSA